MSPQCVVGRQICGKIGKYFQSIIASLKTEPGGRTVIDWNSDKQDGIVIEILRGLL